MHILFVAAAAASPMGPGSKPWTTGAPESHGLSSSALNAAAKRVAADVPVRYCFLVAAGGELTESQSAEPETKQVRALRPARRRR